MKMVINTITKKIIYVSSVVGAIITILGSIGWIYNEYQDFKRKSNEELDKRIMTLIENHGNELLVDIHEKTEKINEEIDSLQKKVELIVEGNTFFAIGLRGDGSGSMWYRDAKGKIHNVYYNVEMNSYYYINNNGMPVKVNY